MGEVHQFPKGGSAYKKIRKAMSAAKEKACARILEVAYEEATQRFNMSPFSGTGHAGADRLLTFGIRVEVLQETLQRAEELQQQEANTLARLS
jgi:hypothetical protein